jgi:hypothetical protein
VDLVRNTVELYIQNGRTIILAVLPSKVDITTQEILKMAEKADPGGVRTMGVLTKPSLVPEVASRKAIKKGSSYDWAIVSSRHLTDIVNVWHGSIAPMPMNTTRFRYMCFLKEVWPDTIAFATG